MQEFLEKLGIDWWLLISQGVNFLVLLIVLRIFAYQPIVKILKERKQKIEDGLAKAKEAEIRLHAVDEIAKGRVKKAEEEALGVLKSAEARAKEVETSLIAHARKKEEALMRDAERAASAARDEAARELQKEAAEVVRKAIVKTVELDPKMIDEALVKKAVAQVSK